MARDFAPARAATASQPIGVRLGVAGLLLLLLLWAWLFFQEGSFARGPNGRTYAADWAMYVAAARVMQAGGNPYDHALLYRTEQRMLHVGPTNLARPQIVRVGNPPPAFWLLQPLATLPFAPVAVAWTILLCAAAAAGLLGTLTYLDWRRRSLPTLLFLLMPQTILGAFYGNFAVVAFAGLGAALGLLRRKPAAAGALLACAWLKPPVTLPLALLIIMFHPEQRISLVRGFAAATLTGIGLSLMNGGPAVLLHWLHGLTGYSQDISAQRGIVSLAGLYTHRATSIVRLELQLTVLLAAAALTAWRWWRVRRDAGQARASLAALWTVWLLAAPYAHIYDEVLLALPVLVLMGRDGEMLRRPRALGSLYLLFFSLFALEPTPYGLCLLPLFVLPLAWWLHARPGWRGRERVSHDSALSQVV